MDTEAHGLFGAVSTLRGGVEKKVPGSGAYPSPSGESTEAE